MQPETAQQPIQSKGPSTPKPRRLPRQSRSNSNSEPKQQTQPKSPAQPKQVPKSPGPKSPATQQPKSPGARVRRSRSNVIPKKTDMPEDMQRVAVQVAEQALKKNTIEQNVASDIKKEFDARYGSPWHCVVGRSFGTFVTHEASHFIFFYVDELAVLLFKTN